MPHWMLRCPQKTLLHACFHTPRKRELVIPGNWLGLPVNWPGTAQAEVGGATEPQGFLTPAEQLGFPWVSLAAGLMEVTAMQPDVQGRQEVLGTVHTAHRHSWIHSTGVDLGLAVRPAGCGPGCPAVNAHAAPRLLASWEGSARRTPAPCSPQIMLRCGCGWLWSP